MTAAYRVGLSALALLAVTASGGAQTLPAAPQGTPPQASEPSVGFVSPYEIVHTLRAAGFQVLSRPLREGTTYVARATDFRGILMRVVVDARTGAIRDATRIVPGPGRYGQFYGAPPPYDPVDFDAAVPVLNEPQIEPPMVRPPTALSAPLPLPRPRPAALASRDRAGPALPSQPKSAPTTAAIGAAAPPAKPDPDGKPLANTEVTIVAPPTAATAPTAAAGSTAPKRPAPVVPPLND